MDVDLYIIILPGLMVKKFASLCLGFYSYCFSFLFYVFVCVIASVKEISRFEFRCTDAVAGC